MLRVGRRVLLVGTGPQGSPSLISELDELGEIETEPARGRTAMMRRRSGCPRTRMPWAVALCAARDLSRDSLASSAADEPPHRLVPDHDQGPSRASTVPGARTRARLPVVNLSPSTNLSTKILQPSSPLRMPTLDRGDAMKTVQTVVLFGLISLAPMGLLMVTAFVRINIVLILLRQALGSPQVPGNQVLTALALLLTVIVMRPLAEKVYHDAIVPYTSEKMDLNDAWTAGSRPIKGFMVDQIKTHQS